MKSYKKELIFQTNERRTYINMTDKVKHCMIESDIKEGLLLCSAINCTSSIFVNVDEPGLIQDLELFLERLVPEKPYSRYAHNLFEDNADGHLKRCIMGRGVTIAITNGELELNNSEQIFYGEFDGKREKKVLIKIIGE